MTKRKTPAKSTVRPAVSVQLIPQAHGGALRQGGTNRGGTGRPPSLIRAAARGEFDTHIATLAKIAKSKKAKNNDRIRAIDVLGKYGMDQAVSVADVRECLRQTTDEIREFLSAEQSDQLLARIRPIWMRL